MIRRFPLALALAVLPPTPLHTQEIGPAGGSLVIVGGGQLDTSILERFLELAGGADAPIIVIPTAGGADEYGPYWEGLRGLKAAGATNLTVLHTTDRTVANSDAFVEPLRRARGVWFSGGRQWRLADSYLGTKTHEELWALLGRGGVIGGTSAGATIQGSYLARGDTRNNTIMMGDHEEGMGFLKRTSIDQHLLRRNRQFDLLEVVRAHPDLLGIGIDENTAIVVEGDRFTVIGAGYVAIYDHERALDSGGQFYFLAPGDRFDLKNRLAERPTRGWEPLERVEHRPWRE
ncbi:MAG: cyanophycinase [Gemmatimonadota bacterium]|nr:cyanophycinase [Gemmatimonadota bacterium]MDH5198748.1 cyanophycinase [Gemmatimonadota bacterium]